MAKKTEAVAAWNNAWYFEPVAGTSGNNNKNNNSYRVRPVSATSTAVYGMPFFIMEIPFRDIVEAWMNCESNKRSAHSCVKFRWNATRELANLWEQIRTDSYKPQRSMCFIVNYPVTREVFAASFRDRVVHHYICLRLVPLLERLFVETGNVSFNCRKGYGNLAAIDLFYRLLDKRNKAELKTYILKYDFSNFFMSLDKDLLWPFARDFIRERYKGSDIETLLYLLRLTIYANPAKHCFCRSPRSAWDSLPKRKSLFGQPDHLGMPIGNYPSQELANFLGAIFDAWLHLQPDGADHIRFVDDNINLVGSLESGRELIRKIRAYLADELHITLHPRKIYLQPVEHGVNAIGAVMKPGRKYISNRTRGRFITAMMHFNRKCATREQKIAELPHILCSINSYLGLMKHFRSYRVRRRIAERYILPEWVEFVYFADGFTVCRIRKQYDPVRTLRRRLRSARFARAFLRPKWKAD